ncbi:AAA family ATPase, partial [Microbacterium sp.]|uniref:AAA family ATPase n=1 Tax=Microbacterium sp. TaxID=51671 RepID=UPI003C74282D
MSVERVPVDQDDGLARAVILVVELDRSAVLVSDGDVSHGRSLSSSDRSGPDAGRIVRLAPLLTASRRWKPRRYPPTEVGGYLQWYEHTSAGRGIRPRRRANLSKLLGRRAERHEVEQLLAEARAGRSGALVVRGEAGIGKTALLEHVRATADALRFRTETSTGVEAETQFAFAGLHQLCAPLLDRAGALPEPQQLALGVALGNRVGPAPDRFLVGLATLNLLAEAAEHRALLCLIDDAQWLDQASAEVLAFVARRISADRLALVFGLRDTDPRPAVFAGLPELRLSGLDDADSRTLLSSAVPVPLDGDVRERIIAEARGNPLALLELPASTQLVRLAGGFLLPDLADVPSRVESGFQRRASALSEAAQTLLLIAAADPTGDASLLRLAAAHVGIATDSAALAETAGLMEVDARVRFRHPLVRSAVYRAADAPDRRRVHEALAAC